MPFRLTPQIINLLRPLTESGELRSCMIHTMRALRYSPDLLLNTMDVFVKEPSLDWKVCSSSSLYCLLFAHMIRCLLGNKLRHKVVTQVRKFVLCIT